MCVQYVQVVTARVHFLTVRVQYVQVVASGSGARADGIEDAAVGDNARQALPDGACG